MGEIETHTLAVYKLTRLFHMGAQHLAKSGLHKVSRRVVSHGGLSCLCTNLGGHLIGKLKGSLFHLADMKIYALSVFGCGFHLENSAPLVCQPSAVARLTAAFSVEGGSC